MLNKELLMTQAELTQAELPSVCVLLEFFGGRNSGTDYTWISPDGTLKTRGVFDERVNISTTLICKPNTSVSIRTDNYSGDYTAIPPQDITVVGAGYEHHLTFTAFRNVSVTF